MFTNINNKYYVERRNNSTLRMLTVHIRSTVCIYSDAGSIHVRKHGSTRRLLCFSMGLFGSTDPEPSDRELNPGPLVYV